MGEFLFFVKLKHESLDELQYSNIVLVTLDGFISAILSKLGDNTLSALSVKNCEHPFQIIFQRLLSVNYLIILAVSITFLTIVRAFLPPSNTGYVGADSVSFEIVLTTYCTSLPFF